MASPGAAGSIRLDKLLWFLRLARSRSMAQAMVEAGHIRLDGRRITRSSCAVHAGSTLVLPVGERIEVLRLLSLPLRRGPVTEAQGCYLRLDPALPATASPAIDADGNALHPQRRDPPNQ
ncbi:MAG: RNA-binding S4 domain-containing protein [Sphingomonadales bacterium]|nr:MAG: RNA-binding S4 domain-containing protein [Sphingomonadales bacterium]